MWFKKTQDAASQGGPIQLRARSVKEEAEKNLRTPAAGAPKRVSPVSQTASRSEVLRRNTMRITMAFCAKGDQVSFRIISQMTAKFFVVHF